MILAGCSRKLAPRFSGRLFTASAGARGIAVADLSQFKHMLTIPLEHGPSQLIVAAGVVYAVCPEGRSLVKVDMDRLVPAATVGFPGRIAAAAATPDGRRIVVAVAQPSTLFVVDAGSAKILQRIALAVGPQADAVAQAVGSRWPWNPEFWTSPIRWSRWPVPRMTP